MEKGKMKDANKEKKSSISVVETNVKGTVDFFGQ